MLLQKPGIYSFTPQKPVLKLDGYGLSRNFLTAQVDFKKITTTMHYFSPFLLPNNFLFFLT